MPPIRSKAGPTSPSAPNGSKSPPAKGKAGKPVLPPVKSPSPPGPKPGAVKASRPVIYPEIEVNSVRVPPTIITKEIAKALLGWETEEDYHRRTGEKIDFGEDYLLKDMYGKKVRCYHNSNNRPFTESWSRELGQNILRRDWADSRNGEDMTVNGETIIITKTGEVDSGQHRLVGLVLACEEWEKQKAHWSELWPEEPTIEALIVTGVSDNSKVTQTLDYVKPRSLSDIFYTSPLFRDLGNMERRECSRMLSYATDLFWERTRAADGFTRYQTHSVSMDLIDRHPRMLECVKTIFACNSERVLSTLKLRAGDCACLLYLMGSSASDGEDYHVAQPAPSEKLVNWENWDKAVEFFKLLVNTKDESFKPLRDAIVALVDSDDGLGGRAVERHALLCKAWNYFLDGKDGEELVDDPPLAYRKDVEDRVVLDERPSVGGIDIGPKAVAEPKTPDATGVVPAEKTKAEQRVKELDAKAKSGLTPTQVQVQQTEKYLQHLESFNKAKKANGNKILLFRTKDGYMTWASDAVTVALLAKGRTARHDSGLHGYFIPREKYPEVVSLLLASRKEMAVIKEEGDGGTTEAAPPPPPPPKPVVSPAPARKPSTPTPTGKGKTLRGGTN